MDVLLQVLHSTLQPVICCAVPACKFLLRLTVLCILAAGAITSFSLSQGHDGWTPWLTCSGKSDPFFTAVTTSPAVNIEHEQLLLSKSAFNAAVGLAHGRFKETKHCKPHEYLHGEDWHLLPSDHHLLAIYLAQVWKRSYQGEFAPVRSERSATIIMIAKAASQRFICCQSIR